MNNRNERHSVWVSLYQRLVSSERCVFYGGTTGMDGTQSKYPGIKDLSQVKGVCSMDE